MDQPGKHEEQTDSPPPPNPARRGFFGSMGAVALLLSACGGSDPSDPAPAPPPPAPAPPPPPPAALSCGATAISDNHGHTLTIPAADVDSTVVKMYSIAGVADHGHTITLTPAQLAQIKGMTSVTVTSSVDLSHFHSVTVNCA